MLSSLFILTLSFLLDILNALDLLDDDVFYLKQAQQKVSSINDMRYGSDSSLLNLYHLIREAPVKYSLSKNLQS